MGTKSGIVAPLDNRVYLFNLFEKPTMTEKDFTNRWLDDGEFVRKQDHYLTGHLHQSLGAEARFQWITLGVFDSRDVCVFGKPNPAWIEKLKTHPSDFGIFPGEYNEISSYNGEAIIDAPKERPDEVRFLLTVVTAKDSVSSDDLEANWKSWMKADFVHEQLKGNMNLKDSLLYRMVGASVPLARYVVRTELSSMDDSEGVELAKMTDKQLNVDGVETFTGFYKIYANIIGPKN